jgi:ABC-type glycerol-3-phosphate transport system permease component
MNSTGVQSNFWSSKKRTERITKIAVWLILVLGSVTMLLPIFWMFSTALKTEATVFATPPIWIPLHPLWKNFVDAWNIDGIYKSQGVNFTTYTINTIIISVSNAIGVMISSAVVAYAFARLRFPGRDVLFLLCLATLMIPYQVTMIPTFILFRNLGWYNTYYPLIVPAFLGGGAFNIFLVRQFFMTIPYELDEAGKIDGCSHLGIFYRILLPLCKPALATVGVFSFVYNWNDFLNPLIYINSNSKYTLTLGLTNFVSFYGQQYNLLMAASLVISIPVIIIFLIGNQYFIRGIATTGFK